MVQIYRELLPEAIILILALGSLVFIPLYLNMHTVSLHISGSDWDEEISVLGASMYPTLKVNDFICVAKVNASLVRADPRDGDILVFERSRVSPDASTTQYPKYAAHRAINKIVRNGMTYFETKGDNNDLPDQWTDYRGEDYAWNGMFSELLLLGRVVGIRKTYAVEFPVAAMTMFLVSVIGADIVISASLIRKNAESHALMAEDRSQQARPRI